MSAVDKNKGVAETYYVPRITSNGNPRALQSKTHSAAAETLIEPPSYHYPTKKRVRSVFLPVEQATPPSKPRKKIKKEEPEIDFITFLERAVASVQRKYPAGKSAAMKWSVRVAEAGTELEQAYFNEENNQIKKLFTSRDRCGFEQLLRNTAEK